MEHPLETLLEFPPVLGPRDELPQVQGKNGHGPEAFGHVAVHDAQGKPFHDGRLPDSRFTDDDGVVLETAAENLDGQADFVVPSDDRVQFSLACAFGEITSVLGQVFEIPTQGGARTRSVGRWDFLQSQGELFLVDSRFRQGLGGLTGFEHGQEQVMEADVFFSLAARRFFRRDEQAFEVPVDGGLL